MSTLDRARGRTHKVDRGHGERRGVGTAMQTSMSAQETATGKIGAQVSLGRRRDHRADDAKADEQRHRETHGAEDGERNMV